MLFLSWLSPRGCLVVFQDTKTDFFFLVLSYDAQFFLGSFEADFGLSLGQVLCHVYGQFVVPIGTGLLSGERVVSGVSFG